MLFYVLALDSWLLCACARSSFHDAMIRIHFIFLRSPQKRKDGVF